MDPATDGEDGRWMTYAELATIRGIDRQSAARLSWRRHWRRQKDNHGTLRVFVPIEWQDGSGDASRDEPREPSRDVSRDISRVIEPLEAAIALLREQLEGANSRADRAERRADEAAARLDARMKVGDSQREQIVAIEAKVAAETARADDLHGRLAEAEQVKEAARKRAHELANRMMRLEAEAEEGRETKERLTGLDRLLADAEHRLTEAEQGRRTAQDRLDAQDRAEVERRGKGRWARLRAAWRGE